MKKKMTQIASVLGIIAILAMIGFGLSACGEDDDTGGTTTKTVTVGTQSGTLNAGTAGTVTYPVTTANIANGTYNVTVANRPSGVTVGNSGTLTLAASANATTATTSTLTLTLDGVTSAVFAIAIDAPAFVLEYAIGDTGPGDGKIIYVSASGFNVTGLGTCHYLEAAPVDQEIILAWASSGYTSTYIEGTGTAIGTGKANTAAILAVDANAPAAKACADYRGGDKDDWFLPSRGELDEMYEARSHLGISPIWYWCSSQYNDSYALQLDFEFYELRSGYKGDVKRVRAVRAF